MNTKMVFGEEGEVRNICGAAPLKGGGGLCRLWAFLDIDENIQKIMKKTRRIFDTFSIVKFECLYQFG